MSSEKRRGAIKTALLLLRNFALFFGIISFVITCTFLLFSTSVSLSDDEVRAFAPLVFINIFVLAAIFVLVDHIRRKIIVERPVREIQRVLKKLTEGDFKARISVSNINNENGFKDIAESINILAEELSGVETLRTDFIANVSHELKTPLAVMQNYGTMLQSSDLNEKRRIEYARAITDACRSLASLITNILKLNKLENQQIFPSVTQYSLTEQLCECLLQFEDVWEKKNIDIETELDENISINSDPELLELVWNNLLSNAFKFTENGGNVSVTLTADEEYAAVKISDTGCGMSPETGEHIFEKFYQGDTSHSTQGNGLGLALVKRVVDIVQGEISVESAVGKGSTFTVKIRRGRHNELEKDG
ncbi:MAG: ATP-binding protein [Huintestinicola sp.]|uniref:HAMP domain-containing sensor histidine kinase n=1 Tax=Huintestinicola sp. TaxID=2981661 RepID=UPI003F0CA341